MKESRKSWSAETGGQYDHGLAVAGTTLPIATGLCVFWGGETWFKIALALAAVIAAIVMIAFVIMAYRTVRLNQNIPYLDGLWLPLPYRAFCILLIIVSLTVLLVKVEQGRHHRSSPSAGDNGSSMRIGSYASQLTMQTSIPRGFKQG